MSSISYISSGGFILGFDHRLLDSSNNPITDSNNEYIYTDTWTISVGVQNSSGGFFLGGSADNFSSSLYQEESFISSGGFVVGFDHRLLDSSNNPITDSDYNFIYTDTWTTSLVEQNILGGCVFGGTSPNNSTTNISNIDFISSGGFVAGFDTDLNATIFITYSSSEGSVLAGSFNSYFVVNIEPVNGILFGGSAPQTIKTPSYQDHISVGGFVLGSNVLNSTINIRQPISDGFLFGADALITCKQNQESVSGFILGSDDVSSLSAIKVFQTSSSGFVLSFSDSEVFASVNSIPTDGAIISGEAGLDLANLVQYDYVSSGGFIISGISDKSSLSNNISSDGFFVDGKCSSNNSINYSPIDGLIVEGSLDQNTVVSFSSISGIVANGSGGPFTTNGIVNFGYIAVGGSIIGGSSTFTVIQNQGISSGFILGSVTDFISSYNYIPQSGGVINGSLLNKSKSSFLSTSGFISFGQAQNKQIYNKTSFGNIILGGSVYSIYTGMLSDIIDPYIINHTIDYYIASQQQNFYFNNKTTSRYISAEV